MVLSGHRLLRIFPPAALLVFALGAAGFARAAEPGDLAGTLPEDSLPELKAILATALQRSPQALEAQFGIEQREAGRMRERAARLPSLGANFNYGSTELKESGNNTTSSRDNGLFYSVNLSQPVFHWGALKNQSDIARINVLLAEKNLAKVYRDLAVLLRRMYLGLVAEKASLKQGREALRLQRENIAVLKERLARGAISPAEVAGEELRLRESTLQQDRREADFLTSRASFSRVAGVPPIAESAIADELPRPVFSAALTTALSAAVLRDGAKSTLEAEMLDLRVREALLRYRIERVRLLPKFSASYNYSLENTTTVGTSVGQRAVDRQTVGIGGSWAIFDGLATRAAKLDAKIGQRIAEARREAELAALQGQVQALERQLKLDAEQLELVEIRRGMALEGLRRVTEEVALGNIAKGEIDRQQNGVLAAEAQAFQARAALLARWSEFVALAGADPVLQNLPVRHAREK